MRPAIYSGPGRSGMCLCGHSWKDHHLGMVLAPGATETDGGTEVYLPQECEFFGWDETGAGVGAGAGVRAMTNLSRRAFLMASGAPFIRSGQQSAIDIPISDKGLPWDPQDPPVTPFRSRPQWGASGLAEVTTDGSAIYAELRYPTEDR